MGARSSRRPTREERTMIDPAEVEGMVRDDTRLGLGDAFEPTEGFAVVRLAERDGLGDADVLDDPITNQQATAVAWTWTGIHTSASERLPYQPTDRPVVVNGLTVVTEDDDGEPRFHRFVDWVSALAQIGVTLTDRPVWDVPEVLEDIDDLLKVARADVDDSG
jgi:hypothetical protein